MSMVVLYMILVLVVCADGGSSMCVCGVMEVVMV